MLNRPMTITRATEADKRILHKMLNSTVQLAWVRHCGESCDQVCNPVVAPISSLRIEPR